MDVVGMGSGIETKLKARHFLFFMPPFVCIPRLDLFMVFASKTLPK